MSRQASNRHGIPQQTIQGVAPAATQYGRELAAIADTPASIRHDLPSSLDCTRTSNTEPMAPPKGCCTITRAFGIT
eukprot:scaffold2045_cov404-Prasinococcus_capsulatus_cf.AAC.24